MRDLLLVVPAQATQEWNLDIDIVDGMPLYVPEERNTQDQRAAISSYMFKGSIPGKPDMGISWASLYEADYEETLVALDNEIKQNIQKNAAVPTMEANSMYIPLYDSSKDGISLAIYQG